VRPLRLVLLGLLLAAPAAAATTDDWTVAGNNPIIQIYVVKSAGGEAELVFELKSMEFSSNQRLYSGIFVNGHVVDIKEYNTEDSYVRGVVALPADGQITAYAGVIKAPEAINPHDQAALWNAFVRSPHQPFRAKVADLPAWYVRNPIKDRAAGYPHLKPEQRPAKAKEALDPATGDKARFYAVWGLAISGYCPEGAEALAIVATDPKQEPTTRDYAGMGLRNYSGAMPEEIRGPIQARLRKALAAEKEKLPDGVLRTLVGWGDADLIRETLGERLRGHPMEIEVLQKTGSRQEAVARLMEMYKAAPEVTSQAGWYQRSHVGTALVKMGDKRGVDILLECLTVEKPWPLDNDSAPDQESNAASFRQCLNNTFRWVARAIGQDFDYSTEENWRPELNKAIPRMVEWWKANREQCVLADPTVIRPRPGPSPR
jgi:hypothetical protein